MSNCALGDTPAKGDKFSLHQCPENELEKRIWRGFLCLGNRKSHVCTSLYVKQTLIASSTMEAEFIACYEASNHGIWLRNFITRLRIVDGIEKPLRINCDNKAAELYSKNNRSSSKSKHIDIKFLVVKERVQSLQVSIEHISTNSMIADPLTKVAASLWLAISSPLSEVQKDIANQNALLACYSCCNESIIVDNSESFSQAWTQEEKLALIRAYQIYRNKWAELTKLLSEETDNAIKNH
ncbi:hypothetical protein AAG906_014775 [Vitis piasezkii]